MAEPNAEEMFAPLPPSPPNGQFVHSDFDPHEPHWRVLTPVPDDVPVIVPSSRLGEPDAVWDYRDENGRLLGRVVRWDGENGAKEIRPLTYCESNNGERAWRWQQFADPRPLYGLDHLARRPGAEVIVGEGEKSADAASRLFPKYVAITSPGGSDAAHTADWSPLCGRNVVIWPDNDDAGRRYAAAVTALARAAGAATVRVVDIPHGWPRKWDLAEDPLPGVTTADLEAMLQPHEVATASSKVPDSSVVRRTVLPAPSLDLGAFGPLANWIKRAAESKSAPADYVATTLLATTAGIVGASHWVSPWAGWREPAILWMLLVGSPSAGKSPAMDAVRDPLAEVESAARADWPATRRAHEAAKITADERREKWETDARAAVKAGREPEEMPSDAVAPREPKMPRIVVTDATIEAIASVLIGNPAGLLMLRDEGSGWLGNLDKYGGGDRAFWVETYGGRTHTIDRKKHPEPLHIEHMAVSIAGGIQPDRLATLLMTGDDDGMASRFLVTWPESVPPTRPRNLPEDGTVVRTLQRLHELRSNQISEDGKLQPITLPVESDALGVFQDWRQHHHEASQSASGLLASALGKMPGQALRLALVLEVLWWAVDKDGAPAPTQVSARALGAALDMIEGYFKPMLRRVLGEAALPAVDRNAAVLARAIQSRRADRINARQVRREWRLPGLREATDVAAAIGALEEAGWLTAIGDRAGGTAGRHRSDYLVDPRVHGGSS